MTTIFLGFGSNLGHRVAAIESAIGRLAAMDGMQLLATSNYYESPALLPDNAPDDWNRPYINAVASFSCTHTPHYVLAAIKQIEQEAGRQPSLHWGPRELDVDILAFGHEVLRTETLNIPHPQLTQRDFVLLPWNDIAPDWRHPVAGEHQGMTIADLCVKLPQITAQTFIRHAA